MSRKPYHVLFTAAWYPNRVEPDKGVFVKKHARAIARQHRVSVLAVQSDPAKRSWGAEIETEEQEGILVVRGYVRRIDTEIPVLTGVLRFLLFCIASLKGFAVIRRRRGLPDLSHVNVLTRAGLLPYLLRKRYGIPYIVTEHWSRYHRGEYPGNPIHHFITRLIVREAGFVAPVSRNLQEAMIRKELLNERYTLVGNVVDTDVFHPEETAPSDKIRMLHISWMRDEAKNISGLLRVLKTLSEERNDFGMVFVGEGNDRQRLIRYSEELGLSGVVEFVGKREGEGLAGMIRSCDFLVLFSNYENQPVCVLESLACGKPVVATRVGAIPSMLEEGRGVLVTPGDEGELRCKLSWMLDHHASFDANRLSGSIREGCSEQAVCKAYDKLYREICSR